MAQITAPPTSVRPEPQFDQYGRYVIPDPRTGKRRSWTRATTWASSIADTHALTNWQIRMTALGLTQRPDLFAGVAAVADPSSPAGKKLLGKLCEQAKEHAGTSQRATLGTALHSFAEQVDIGREPMIPAPWDADIKAYRKAIRQAGIVVSPNYVERIAVLPSLGVAGKFDRIVKFNDRLTVCDIKTGQDLAYSWTEIAIQLGIYAHAEYLYDIEGNRHFRMPKEVDREQAIVVHLPAGEGRCTLYLVDIDAGWRTAHLCGMVRDWRKRRDLATALESVSAVVAGREDPAA